MTSHLRNEERAREIRRELVRQECEEERYSKPSAARP